jgi:G:T/U-mismatch repair DNA glycosylase
MNAAVLRGGLLAVVAYSLLGRGVGCPLGGRASDAARKAGVARTTVAMTWLISAMLLLWILSTGMNSAWSLGIIAFLVGVSINSFSLINASIADTYGPQRTASIVSFVNMVAQFAGATGLAISGYAGISLSGQAGNALAEYRGIWLSAMAGVAIMTGLGMAMLWRARAGQSDAAGQVKGLRKPTVPVWTVNTLACTQRREIQTLLAAGARLRTAQERALAGGTDELRAATAEERAALGVLTRHADALLSAEGRGTGAAALERVASTLRAAATDPAARDLLAAGRLTEELTSSGFGALAGMKIPATSARRSAAKKAEPGPTPAQRRAKLEKLRDKARKLDAEAKEAERAARSAEAGAAKARRTAETAVAAAEAARAAVEEAEGATRR